MIIHIAPTPESVTTDSTQPTVGRDTVGGDSVSIQQPADLRRFHVEADSSDEQLVGAALGAAGHAAESGHVWVSADWIRATVSGVDDNWSGEFDQMLAYAASQGWLNEDRTHIKAHIEPR